MSHTKLNKKQFAIGTYLKLDKIIFIYD